MRPRRRSPDADAHACGLRRRRPGLIDIRNLAQLDAIRYDPNGNGDATHAYYVSAFPNRVTASSGRRGCPSGACTGYELRADLSFDENGDGQMTSAGDPTNWNSGAGWEPIAFTTTYTATFRGNGHTVSYPLHQPDLIRCRCSVR